MTLRELIIHYLRQYEMGDTLDYFWYGEYDAQLPCWRHVETTREEAPAAYKGALESLSDEDLWNLSGRLDSIDE